MSISDYATETVSTWIISEGEQLAHNGTQRRVAEHAAEAVRANDLADLRRVTELAITTSGTGRWAAAGEVAEVLNDEGGLDAVDWAEVATAVRLSADIH